MLKKIIPIAISLCLIFGISVMAEDTNAVNEENASGVSQQAPQIPDKLPQAEQGDLGMPPSSNIQNGRGNMQNGGQMPDGMEEFFKNMQNSNQDVQLEQPTGFWGFVKTNSTPIISVILLALAFIFVIFYRRKNY